MTQNNLSPNIMGKQPLAQFDTYTDKPWWQIPATETSKRSPYTESNIRSPERHSLTESL